jgi:hypothetical protein
MSPEEQNNQTHEGTYTDLPHDMLRGDPVRRRAWLLSKALESFPLDRALELARAAEEFISGSVAEKGNRSPQFKPAPKPQTHRTGLALSAQQRNQLLQRIAEGATNAVLANEFGLSRRQVQGIRMGSAAEIAARRSRRG